MNEDLLTTESLLNVDDFNDIDFDDIDFDDLEEELEQDSLLSQADELVDGFFDEVKDFLGDVGDATEDAINSIRNGDYNLDGNIDRTDELIAQAVVNVASVAVGVGIPFVAARALGITTIPSLALGVSKAAGLELDRGLAGIIVNEIEDSLANSFGDISETIAMD